jgi:hypothetical protein
MKLSRYIGVRGKRNVAMISAALEKCGARILSAPDPSVAPYEYLIELPNGERRDLVCYAFTANRYKGRKRPDGEHRFQIKYGSEFHRYHDLFIDPKRRRTTLLFGVHEKLDLFISADPILHTPTWFSCSVEFKDRNLRLAKKHGWHGWERDRTKTGRRKRQSPLESFQTEAICAFTPKHFLNYIEFERLAFGLDAAERLVVGREIAKGGALKPGKKHPLEQALSLSAAELLDVLGGTGRLLTAVRGRVAEHHLGVYLRSLPSISKVEAIDQDGPPDYSIVYRRRPFRIECKNVGPDSKRPKVDFQKTRAAIGDRCSRYYSATQFEVLAACMNAVTQEWEYRFCPTTKLPEHTKCKGKLSNRVYVEGPAWGSLPNALDAYF